MSSKWKTLTAVVTIRVPEKTELSDRKFARAISGALDRDDTTLFQFWKHARPRVWGGADWLGKNVPSAATDRKILSELKKVNAHFTRRHK